MQTFIGHYTCSVDNKGRMMIPARFRRMIPADSGELLVLSKGKENNLNLYPVEGWKEIMSKLRELPAGPKKRNLVRYYSDKSYTLSMDKAGRVAIPSDFLSIIGNPDKIIVIGALTYMEIWAEKDYPEVKKKALEIYIESDWEH
jgi:MraZ protein